jgi:acyclic terpene utilization AtuA family protein
MTYRILANCVVGLGFSRRGFATGLAARPDLIGCDAGSADFGPAPLGSGVDPKSATAVLRDLELMVTGAAEVGAPLVIGSCGGAGDDPHLAGYVDYVDGICRKAGLRRRVAVIHARQDKDTVRRAVRDGGTSPLGAVGPLTEADVDSSAAIVAMMGATPIRDALAGGADIVLAGRAVDPAIFAAGPLLHGLPAGVSWHAAKSIDKGYLACTDPSDGSPVLAELEPDGFTLTPTKATSRCTVQSVARITMHENPNPFRIAQPEGVIDTEGCTYRQLDDGRGVRVTGSVFHPADTVRVKLEGARFAGHRKVAIIGLRDPRLLADLDGFLADFQDKLARSMHSLGVDRSQWTLRCRQYGRDAVLGAAEPLRDVPPREVGLVLDVVAETAELAELVLRKSGPIGSRLDRLGNLGGGGNFAYPFSPNVLDGGQAYEWSIWHLMAADDGVAPFATEYVELGVG